MSSDDTNKLISGVSCQFLIETSDHDGYCSDGTCDYSNTTHDHTITFDELLTLDQATEEMVKIGNVVNSINQCGPGLNVKYAAQIEGIIPSMGNGSGYCKLSVEASRKGLTNHDFRLTLISHEFVYGS